VFAFVDRFWNESFVYEREDWRPESLYNLKISIFVKWHSRCGVHKLRERLAIQAAFLEVKGAL
jgi:hypothetical protein